MARDDVDNFLAHLSRKRARDEEENKKKMTIILSTITCIIAIVGAWYNENYLVKEPSRDWDEERQCRLNRLYNGKEVDCIEQLRVRKKAFQSLCTILHGKGGLVRTRNVSSEESIATFLNILAHNLKFRVIGFDYYRSKETISRQFNSVLRAMMRISQEYLKLQPCDIGGSEREKWKWFEISTILWMPDMLMDLVF
ncbi:unnamed protein product [Prunus armeniaca]|uniref:DUF8040 domain-containing protein n=1 Tax=Prunus armeniaca TaxID=36596 RepID=A0A6J5X9H1_PRUAR|nr:unnamed protein product [Prunus armeniaca]